MMSPDLSPELWVYWGLILKDSSNWRPTVAWSLHKGFCLETLSCKFECLLELHCTAADASPRNGPFHLKQNTSIMTLPFFQRISICFSIPEWPPFLSFFFFLIKFNHLLIKDAGSGERTCLQFIQVAEILLRRAEFVNCQRSKGIRPYYSKMLG